jgi:hypothetical protein
VLSVDVASTLSVLSASFFEGVLQELADTNMKNESIHRPLVSDFSLLEITIITFNIKIYVKGR